MTSATFFMLVVGIILISAHLCASSCRFGCTECESYYKCTACRDKYGLKVDGSRTTCERCGVGKYRCNACEDYNIEYCTECSSLYMLKDGKCLDCGLYCDDCSSDKVCTQCSNYRVLVRKADTVVCERCDQFSECVKCADFEPGKCLECRSGYNLNENGRCVRCELSNCAVCDSDLKTCRKCDAGSRLTSENKCEFCLNYGCAKCENDRNVCQECKPGYGGLAAGRCALCKITGCLKCPDPTACEECDPKFSSCAVGVTGAAKPATTPATTEDASTPDKNIPGCVKYSADKQTCESCELSLYINSNGECASCPYGCFSCLSYELCTQCVEGMGLQKDVQNRKATCKQCEGLYCNLCYDDNKKCTQCSPGYKVNLNAAGGCESQNCAISYCADCVADANTCVKCKEGYKLESNKCTACELNGCATCENGPYKCSQCKEYYPQCLINDAVTSCADKNCADCSSDLNVCTRCNYGYYDTSNCKNCRAEHAHCLRCANDGTCRKCDAMYTLENGKCNLPRQP